MPDAPGAVERLPQVEYEYGVDVDLHHRCTLFYIRAFVRVAYLTEV